MLLCRRISSPPSSNLVTASCKSISMPPSNPRRHQITPIGRIVSILFHAIGHCRMYSQVKSFRQTGEIITFAAYRQPGNKHLIEAWP